MKNKIKYEFLIKEILEKDYKELKSFKLISEKYNICSSTIQRYYKEVFKIKTKKKTLYNVNHELFSLDNEISFYLAGFIAADGCIIKHKSSVPNYVSICLSKKDLDHLKKIKNMLGFGGPISHSIKKHSEINKNYNDVEMIRINVYSKKIINDLSRFGIGQRKSLTYTMPKWLIKHHLINHFLRGYNDGDGSFYIGKENVITKTLGLKIYSKLIFSLRGTEKFLSDFKNILSKNNINTASKPVFNNGIYQLRYSGNGQVAKVSKFLYKDSTIYMDRKFDKVKHLL